MRSLGFMSPNHQSEITLSAAPELECHAEPDRYCKVRNGDPMGLRSLDEGRSICINYGTDFRITS